MWKKPGTDQLVALQFMAVVLPIAVVLLMQMAGDSRRAATLEQSHPLRILADEARANYKTFTNGAADAVDTGALGGQSVDALRSAAQQLAALAERDKSLNLLRARDHVQSLAAAIPKRASVDILMPLRVPILEGDELTKTLAMNFDARDDLVVEDAIASAVRQKRAVVAALLISTILTVLFVLATQRRLTARIAADIAAERRHRAEVETSSIRFAVATRAARAGVYELQTERGEVWWSDTMYELYDKSPSTFTPTLSSWLALIHPDDRLLTESAIATALRDGSPLRFEHRILRPDGTVRHIASLADISLDLTNANSRLVGIDLDITEQVAANERERKLQQQLRDASRQAGMAEIATNVLHNVGNVLNSVNVSANLAAESIKKSRVAGLGKVVALLQQHETDLGAFISTDERGKHLPAYLAQLSEHLKRDQGTTLAELDELNKNIEHIKEIVVMQQNYAKLLGVPETVTVSSLVDDGLRMNAGAFTRHGVKLEREFEDVPPIVVDKHKVLQILINLLRNAKYACEESGLSNRQVIVRIAKCADGVQVSVADNGVGIREEHIAKIFSHGFTTRKHGHGFGLHSGALAAKELGGSLRVHSAGPDRGATFTLELPQRPPEMMYAA